MKSASLFFTILILFMFSSLFTQAETFKLKYYEDAQRAGPVLDLGSQFVEASKEFPSGLKHGPQNVSKGTRYYTPEFAGRKIFFALGSSHHTTLLSADTDMDNDLHDEKGYEARHMIKDIKAHFSAIKIQIPCGGIKQEIEISANEDNNGLNFYAKLRSYYAGNVRFGNRRYYFVLGDRTIDGLYDDFLEGDAVDKCDYMGIDFDGNGGITYDSPVVELLPLSKTVLIGNEYYSILPAPDGKSVTIEKTNPKLGVLDVQNADARLSLMSNNGPFELAGSNGKWQLPVGTYSATAAKLVRKDKGGQIWEIECVANESKLSKFNIREGETITIGIGTPLLLKTSIDVTDNYVIIDLSITGRNGEQYQYVNSPNMTLDDAPKFKIINRDGKEILKDSFTYG